MVVWPYVKAKAAKDSGREGSTDSARSAEDEPDRLPLRSQLETPVAM